MDIMWVTSRRMLGWEAEETRGWIRGRIRRRIRERRGMVEWRPPTSTIVCHQVLHDLYTASD